MLEVFLGVLAFLPLLVHSAQPDCVVDNFQVEPNFNVSKFLGRWYELRYKPPWVPDDVKKVWTNYLHVYRRQQEGGLEVIELARRNHNDSLCSERKWPLLTTSVQGKLRFEAASDTETPNTEKKFLDYWVMVTDYEHYALVYGCHERGQDGTCGLTESWVWGRQTTMSAHHTHLVNSAIKNTCMGLEEFYDIKHDNECPTSKSAQVKPCLDGAKYWTISLLAVFLIQKTTFG